MFEVFAKTTFCPALGAFKGLDIIIVIVGKRSELVESHVNVGADATLNLH